MNILDEMSELVVEKFKEYEAHIKLIYHCKSSVPKETDEVAQNCLFKCILTLGGIVNDKI